MYNHSIMQKHFFNFTLITDRDIFWDYVSWVMYFDVCLMQLLPVKLVKYDNENVPFVMT